MKTPKWKKLKSLAAIERYQSQFDESDKFDCSVSHGTMPNGAFGRVEIYSLNGAPKFKVATANDGSFGAAYGV